MVTNSDKKRSLGRWSLRWEYYSKVDLKDTGWEKTN